MIAGISMEYHDGLQEYWDEGSLVLQKFVELKGDSNRLENN